jgi:hypothetical protein
MDYIKLISAAGLGGIVGGLLTAVMQSWLANKQHLNDRSFQEKKESYIGLLEAYHKAAVESTDAAAKNFAYWQMRCELVAPQNVRESIRKTVDTNNDKAKRYTAHEELKEALRKDLGVEI